MDKKRKQSLSFAIFKSNFIVISIMAFVLISAFALIAHGMLLQKINTETSLMLSSANTALDNVIKENITLALNISESNEFKYLLRDFAEKDELEQLKTESEIHNILDKYYQGNTAVSSCVIYLDGKKLLTSGSTALQPLSALHEDSFYESHLSLNASLITDYSIKPTRSAGSIYDREKLTILIKITDYNQVCLGYLAVSVSKQGLYYNQVHKHIPREGVYVIDNNGVMFLSASNDDLGNIADFAENTNMKQAGGKTRVTFNNLASTLFYSAASSQGWRVAYIAPHAQLYAWRIYFVFAYLGLVFLMFIICWIIAKKLSPQIVKPVITLASAMEKSCNVPVDGIHHDEFMILYNKYNELLENQAALLAETREKDELQRQTELKALIAQINPHFLYNTLNSIGWHALDANQPQLCGMLSKLSKLCKNSYNVSSMLTTVNDELLNVNLYIDLQKDCFHNKFDYEFCVEPGLEQCIIPKFILQPIVENAIIHGFTQIKNDGKIKITIFRKEEYLVIKITDNGCGIDPDIVEKLNTHSYKSEKFGIYNVNQRIMQLYGNKYGISYQSNGNSKTVVTILLPYHPAE